MRAYIYPPVHVQVCVWLRSEAAEARDQLNRVTCTAYRPEAMAAAGGRERRGAPTGEQREKAIAGEDAIVMAARPSRAEPMVWPTVWSTGVNE